MVFFFFILLWEKERVNVKNLTTVDLNVFFFCSFFKVWSLSAKACLKKEWLWLFFQFDIEVNILGFSLVLYHLSLVQVYRLCDKNFQWYGQNNIFQKTIDIEINNRLRWKMWVSFTSSQNHLCSRFEVIVFGIWIFFFGLDCLFLFLFGVFFKYDFKVCM